MTIFYENYMRETKSDTDINEHLELLYNLGREVDRITEFGVGFGRSTRAFIAAIAETKGSLRSYEIKLLDGVQECFTQALDAGLDANLLLQNILESDIVETDLLLIDSHHTYNQVKQELDLHSHKVSKYILFHDIVKYGLSGQDAGTVGIWPAINEFLDANPAWKVQAQYDNNNGMLVLIKN